MHGGPNGKRSGPAHHNWKGGVTSQYWPKRLRADFDRSINNPQRLELGEAIGGIDARFAELVRALGGENTDVGFVDLAKKWREMERTQLAGQTDQSGQLYAEIKRGVNAAARVESTWRELYRVMEQRRRLVESERKRLVEQAEVITMGQAVQLFTNLQQAVLDNVTDKAALGRIAETFASALGPIISVRGDRLPHAPGIEAGSE